MAEQTITGFHLSPLQRRLWAQSRGRRACALVRIGGTFDLARLTDGIRQVVENNESLRTVFHTPTGMKLPLQVVRDEPSFTFQTLEGADPDEQYLAEASRSVDLENEPALRITLISRGPDQSSLILSAPALVSDAETLRNVVRELVAAYLGNAASESLQYPDFSEWHNSLLTNEEDAAVYARAHFDSLDLATPTPVPFEGCYPGEARPYVFRMQAPKTSLNALTAGWAALVRRFTGVEDVLVWVGADGRGEEELKRACGLYASAVPLRISFAGNPTLEETSQAASVALSEAASLQRYFLGTAGPQVLLDVSPTPETWEVDGVRFVLERAHAELDTPILTIRSLGELIEFSGDPQRLAETDARRLGETLVRLLKFAVEDPSRPVSSYSLLSEAELEQVLRSWNRTERLFESPACVHFGFEQQASDGSGFCALRFQNKQWTYGELNSRANQLAHYLRAKGVAANTVVAVHMERCDDAILSLLAILKAGGAYLPLSPDLPLARMNYMLEEADAKAVISHERHAEALSGFRGPTILLDRDKELLDQQPDTNPSRMSSGDDLAYVIYTSGSTGNPKGVAVRHRNVMNYTNFMMDTLGARNERLTFATVSTLGADLGNTSIFPALASGGCLKVIDFETSLDPGLFVRQNRAHPTDVLKITPSNLMALLGDNPDPEILPRRKLVLGGEASSWDLIRSVGLFGRCSILNHYGPTETTIGCLTFDVKPDSECNSKAVPVGRPIANTQAYVLDAERQPLPPGVAGELFIGGAGVSAGYLNQPDKTMQRFLENPWGPGKLYRTGDRVRWMADGNLEFLCRADDQLKIRGFRVEPGEVEHVLMSHPQVLRAVVGCSQDRGGEPQLCAWIVGRDGSAPEGKVLREHLLASLPEYMVPQAFVGMDSLPLTPNGKLDRDRLPAPETLRISRSRTAATTPIEAQLVEIWSEILGAEVGITDNFFEVGGHSLLATQIIARVRTKFGVQVPLLAFFNAPTVEGLAAAIAKTRLETSEADQLDGLLAELEGLSDEEVARILASEESSPAPALSQLAGSSGS